MRRPRIDRTGCCEAHAQRDLLLGGRFAQNEAEERWERMLRGPCTNRFAAWRPVCREMGADVARPMHKEICCLEAGLPRMRLKRDGSGCCEAHAQRYLLLGGRFAERWERMLRGPCTKKFAAWRPVCRFAQNEAEERWKWMMRGPCRNFWSSEAGFPRRRGDMWREER